MIIPVFFPRLHQPAPEPVPRRRRLQFLQFTGCSPFRKEKRRQINGIQPDIISHFLLKADLRLLYQIPVLQHLIHRHDHGRLLRLQKFCRMARQLIFLSVNMSLLRKITERIHYAAPKAHIGFLLNAQLLRDLVCGAKTDPPDIIRQTKRIFPDNCYALIAILFVYPRRVGSVHAVILQKQHHILDLLLPLPALGNLIHPLFADALHFQKLFDICFNDLQRVRAELLHDPLCEFRPDPLDQPGTQIFFNAVNRGRHGLFPALRHKLPAVLRVHLPVSLRQKHRSHIGIKKIPDQRHQIIITFDAHFQHGISVIRILICNSLDYTAYFHNIPRTSIL